MKTANERIGQANWRAANREHMREYARAYRKANAEKSTRSHYD